MPFTSHVRPRPFLGAAVVVLALAAPAGAGILSPGQSTGGEAYRLTDPNAPQFAGETLETATLPIDITAPGEDGQPRFVRGTLTHKVVRESAGGALAFHYQVDGTSQNETVDFDDFFVTAFGDFATDVFSDQEGGGVDASVRRSADGNEIHFLGSEEPFDGYFIVRTDATEYAAGGAARILARFQTGVGSQDQDQVQSFATFQPTADDPGPGPNPIPLPPAAWAALATMGGFGAVKKLRRGRRGA